MLIKIHVREKNILIDSYRESWWKKAAPNLNQRMQINQIIIKMTGQVEPISNKSPSKQRMRRWNEYRRPVLRYLCVIQSFFISFRFELVLLQPLVDSMSKQQTCDETMKKQQCVDIQWSQCPLHWHPCIIAEKTRERKKCAEKSNKSWCGLVSHGINPMDTWNSVKPNANQWIVLIFR